MRTVESVRLRWCVWLWLLLRVLSIVIAALAFHLKHGIVFFTSMATLLLSPWYVWDAHYYVAIIRDGYQPGEATANFHPLYPWISALVTIVFRDPLFSLLIVSSTAALLLTIAFYRLARLDCDEQQSWQATALLLVWPPSLALFAPYTEALFLLLSAYCLFAARKNRFWLAGLAGGLATLTRQQGILLVLPLAWEVWESSGDVWRKRIANVLALALLPAALAAWILYRWLVINDVPPDFSSVQRFIYSVIISPSTYKILNEQQFLPPWTALWRALTILWRGEVHAGAYVDAAFAAVFVGLLVLSWRYLRTSYRIYSVAIILISLSFYTGAINPYMSLPRHLLLAFPVFIGVASRYKFRKFPLVLGLLTLCQLALLCSFIWQRWVL